MELLSHHWAIDEMFHYQMIYFLKKEGGSMNQENEMTAGEKFDLDKLKTMSKEELIDLVFRRRGSGMSECVDPMSAGHRQYQAS